jgi:hypothetical protein
MPTKLEPVLVLLVACMIFFTGILFASEIWFNNDSQLFQVVAGILTGITGAFLGRIKPIQGSSGKDGADGVAGADGAAATVSVVQENK